MDLIMRCELSLTSLQPIIYQLNCDSANRLSLKHIMRCELSLTSHQPIIYQLNCDSANRLSPKHVKNKWDYRLFISTAVWSVGYRRFINSKKALKLVHLRIDTRIRVLGCLGHPSRHFMRCLHQLFLSSQCPSMECPPQTLRHQQISASLDLRMQIKFFYCQCSGVKACFNEEETMVYILRINFVLKKL